MINGPNYWDLSGNLTSIEFLNHFKNSILFENIFIKTFEEYKHDKGSMIDIKDEDYKEEKK
jgi:hypothetical protein